jgi:hypothetical protein
VSALVLSTRIEADRYITDVFDGAMIVLAMYTLNFFHPGVLLRERRV